MRLLSFSIAVVLAFASQVHAEEALPPAPAISWLFIQNAATMQFDGETLVLSGLAPSVIAFSDRPHRITAPLSNDGFMGLWMAGADDFTVDPPNAGLSVVIDGQLQMAVVELTEPVLDGDRMSYRLVVLEGAVPATGGSASLFIDAFPTSVNAQITDSVSQANVKVLGDAPAAAMGDLFTGTSQALSNAAHNATTDQQQSAVTMQATTNQGVATLLSLDTATTGVATQSMLGTDAD